MKPAPRKKKTKSRPVETPQEQRSRMMRGIRGSNTQPELQVRTALHARGFRYRLNAKDLPGRPDIVLPKWKTVIFVHGCFWHAHQGCRYFRIPATRTEFWEQKLAANAARDARQIEQLLAMGWRVLAVWECALKNKNATALEKVVAFVEGNESFSQLAGASLSDAVPLIAAKTTEAIWRAK
ncbi:hypothetical protein ABB30_11115 [Stenotrophomonas ginsengisoli]|uniref:Very short patch repair endonuclease n=1 Tax=Stenotrophomonas ginsengisoli TaxID=336566 RepID=A0A0R0D1A9_9GAMM|nr:very short patch repair endonuclease [Stenotrophomonas ginsengisoli]KRG75785.1 hypothetical protein ABB30_11115 [Stenotrophomonas ginsengisoli]